ncbi:uncharacterized protein LOC114531731 [Dendronephthya gigantea]|uniref:uncharacterized protein LOC114531731 n=1 Tax=Dendronephthya gigantea TaxID=151771 RepID=UPI0010691DF0|nr:uncharacterized protein LOC114531731 [Dendronephthya gigantea]
MDENGRLTSQELFKVKLSLSCLSNRVTVCPVQAKLYLLKGETWNHFKTGVAAVIFNTGESGDRNPKGVKLCLVELESGFASWNEDLSDNSQYKAQDTKFHTLMLQNNNGANMAGLQFEDEGAASLFLKEIIDSIEELKSSNNTLELSKLEISSRKEKAKKFRKLKKSEISTPCLFTHVTNISSTQADSLDEPESPDSFESRSGSTSARSSDKMKRSFSLSKRR